MFITQAKEIMEACPTARLDAKDANRLVRSVEEEENSLLEPFIGETLIMQLYDYYKTYAILFGGITSDIIDIYAEEAPAVKSDRQTPIAAAIAIERIPAVIPLLRDIQSALVYRMFSNKIYTISTSLNLGGGANRASAGDYDPADDKHIQELRKEFWMNSIHACDNILVKLERDAKLGDASLWNDAWKESDGYYYHEDSLFPTMRDLKKYYPCDQPTRFLAIHPLLIYCQNTYITPSVNSINPSLMDRLLDPSKVLTAEETKARKLLRVGLSLHMQAHQAPKSSGKNATPFNSAPTAYSITPDKNEMIQSADSAMSTALAYIKQHLPYTEDDAAVHGGSPSGSTTEDGVSTPSSSTRCNIYPGHEDHVPDAPDRYPHPSFPSGSGCGCCGGSPDDGDYSTFTTLFAPGLNRW